MVQNFHMAYWPNTWSKCLICALIHLLTSALYKSLTYLLSLIEVKHANQWQDWSSPFLYLLIHSCRRGHRFLYVALGRQYNAQLTPNATPQNSFVALLRIRDVARIFKGESFNIWHQSSPPRVCSKRRTPSSTRITANEAKNNVNSVSVCVCVVCVGEALLSGLQAVWYNNVENPREEEPGLRSLATSLVWIGHNTYNV